MSNEQLIKELEGMEVMLLASAQKCSLARKQLQKKVGGPSSATRKGKELTQAQVIAIGNNRIKNVLRKKAK